MPRVLTLLALALAAVLAVGSPARADFIFAATINGAQENPPNNSAAFGSATFVLNSAQTQMTFTATIFGLDFTGSQTPGTTADNLVAAHIHAGPNSPPGNNPVVWGFFGAPFNDNNPNDQVVTPFAAGVGGTISGKWDLPEGNGTTLAAQLPNIFAGRAYINFHTVGNPGGEIRGFLVLQTPEPVSVLLFAGAAVAAVGVRRFRARRV